MKQSSVRQLASQWRQATLGVDPEQLVPAADLIRRAVVATGLGFTVLPHGDPLLSGASAVLDADANMVWLDGNLSATERWYTLAHEYAHLALHSNCSPKDFAEIGVYHTSGDAGAQVIEGYAPQQRREIDSNIWAAELLLPGPMLRTQFVQKGLGANRIADTAGLSVKLVRFQMRSILLSAPAGFGAPVTPVSDRLVSEPNLDDSQLAAATIDHGPFLLTAGPGTGKTRTLVARCAHLVQDRGIAPDSILALTFSRKAAIEMRERLIAAGVGSASDGPWVGTFHAFCVETLRRYGHHLGLPQNWKVIGEQEAFSLLERNLLRLQLRELMDLPTPTLHLRDITRAISRAKDELCLPKRYAELANDHVRDCNGGPDCDEALRLLEVARIYPVYQQILREARRLDYGDLIVLTVELLESSEHVRKQLQSQYPQVLTDEYQDVNYASARLLKLLAGNEAAGLWAVGDRRQSIYRFRGASPTNVSQFELHYPNGRRGALRTNYRSKPGIVRVFETAAEKLSVSEPETFEGWTCSRVCTDKGLDVSLAVAADSAGQAHLMAEEMKALLGKGVELRDQAVLCRTHAQATQMADSLLREGVPVLYIGDLLERPEVKDLICLVDLFASEGSAGPASLRRAAKLLGARDTRALMAKLVPIEHVSVARAILSDPKISGTEPDLSAQLALLVMEPSPSAILEKFLFDTSDYVRSILQRSSSDPLQAAVQLLAVRRLLELAAEWQSTYERDVISPDEAGAEDGNSVDAVSWFMHRLGRMGLAGERISTNSDATESEIDAVRIMTVHAAKGLEFPAVFLPNMSAGKFPTRDRLSYIAEPRGLASDGVMGDTDQEEEACLFFVALSRARDHLFISRAVQYQGNVKPAEPSPLLRLISDGLSEVSARKIDLAASSRQPCIERNSRENLPLPPAQTKPRYAASALEQYRRCPRQYFYQHIAGLGGTRVEGPYKRYMNCVRNTTAWLQDWWRNGSLPDVAALSSKVDEFWLDGGRSPDLYDQLYRDQALEVVQSTLQSYAKKLGQEIPASDQVLAAELCNCVVSVAADLVTVAPDGGIRATRQRAKAGSSDHTHPKLSLMRAGMASGFKDRPGTIELEYRHTGERREVPASPRYEPGRLHKYEEAADGIAGGIFEATPEDIRICQTCPYHFVCPE